MVLCLLENHVLLRQDTPEIMRVSPEKLARWGNSSVVISPYNDSNNEQVNKLQNVLDMINARSSNFIPYNVRDTSVTGNSL